MSSVRGIVLSVVAAVGLFVALVSWAFSAPVGAAPDDTYHLPTIWCSWGESELCGRDDTGSFLVPQSIAEVCYLQAPSVSASCTYLKNDDLVLAPHLEYSENDAERAGAEQVRLSGNAIYHRLMRVAASPNIQTSALAMRGINAFVAALLFGAALVVSRPGARRALALSWVVAIVPVGMFILASTNPSSWAVAGVGTFWAYLLAILRPAGNRSALRWIAVGGALASALVAVAARSDSLVFLAGSVVAVCVVAWPQIREVRALKIGLVVLSVAFLALIALTSLRDRLTAAAAGLGDSSSADERLTQGGLNPTINHLLELPSFLWAFVGGQAPTFDFPTAYLRGLGWLDTGIPSITGIAVLFSLVAVLVWGMGVYNGRKVLAVGIGIVTLCASIILPLAGEGYRPTIVLQPRYMLPMLFVVAGLTALRPMRSGRPRLAVTVVVVVLMIIANATAQLASLHRYTNGESLPWMRLDMEPNWWWLGAPVGPTTVWIVGAVGFAVFACAVGLIARVGTVGRHREAVKQTFQRVEPDHVRG